MTDKELLMDLFARASIYYYDEDGALVVHVPLHDEPRTTVRGYSGDTTLFCFDDKGALTGLEIWGD